MGIFSKFNTNKSPSTTEGSIDNDPGFSTNQRNNGNVPTAIVKDQNLPKPSGESQTIEESITELSGKIEDIYKKMPAVDKQNKDLESSLNDQKRKIDELIPSVISIFGIFTSIIALLLVEIQLFRVVCDPFQLMGLSMVFAAILLTFIYLLLIFFFKPSTEPDKNLTLFESNEAKFELKNFILKFFTTIRPLNLSVIIVAFYVFGILLSIISRFGTNIQCPNDKIDSNIILIQERISRIEGQISK